MEENKRPFYEAIDEKLNDKEFLKNIRSVVVLLIVIGVPFLYFGLFGSITLETLLSFKLGGLAIMSVALVTMVRADIKARAFDDEIKVNKELSGIETEISEVTKKIKNHKLGRMYVTSYNKSEQDFANLKKTEDTIEHIKEQLSFLEYKGKANSKRYSKLKTKLEEISKHPLKEKYKPIEYDELRSFDSKKMKKHSSSKKKLTYNPKKESVGTSIQSMVTKGLGVGGAGSLPFMIGEDLSTILAFYFALFVAIGMTVLQSYMKTRYNTANKYKETRDFKLTLLRECVQFIDEEEKKAVEVKVVEKLPEAVAEKVEETFQETNTFQFPKLHVNIKESVS